ncbi:MAG TPA: fibronectin type III domain-containing protein, partial [Nocardioides sp.]|nr:fibronectin type III domain-containing protein [Nocardioides sp.]
LWIATYNVHTDVTVAAAQADIAKLVNAGADVIGLQEMGSRERRDAVRAALVDCETCVLDAYMPLFGPEASTPILYRSDKFTLEGSGSHKVSEATYVGDQGAGPSTLKAKFVNWVSLRHLASGRLVHVLNNHAVPSVQAPDGGPNWKLPERLQLYRQHMAGLRMLIQYFSAEGDPVFVTGDFNVNYRKDRVVRASMFPYVQLGGLDTRASWYTLGEPATGTHVLPDGFDKRLIDYVFHRTNPAVTLRTQAILRGYASDHRPVLTSYQLAAAPAEVPPPTTVPSAPKDVSVVRGDKQVTVSWTPTADAAAAVTSQTVTGMPDGVSLKVAPEATSAVVTGLTNGRKYTFTVVATNEVGDSEASAPSVVVVPATVPRTIARPGVTVKDRRAIITWGTPRRTGGSPILGYRVVVDGQARTTGPDARRLVVRLAPGRHRARVGAYNAVGNAELSEPTRFRVRR